MKPASSILGKHGLYEMHPDKAWFRRALTPPNPDAPFSTGKRVPGQAKRSGSAYEISKPKDAKR